MENVIATNYTIKIRRTIPKQLQPSSNNVEYFINLPFRSEKHYQVYPNNNSKTFMGRGLLNISPRIREMGMWYGNVINNFKVFHGAVQWCISGKRASESGEDQTSLIGQAEALIYVLEFVLPIEEGEVLQFLTVVIIKMQRL